VRNSAGERNPDGEKQMRRIAATAPIVAAAAILLLAARAVAQQAQTILPEVTVTAPPVAPPRHFGPAQGMMGVVRVEEDRWPVVPCAASRMNGADAGGKCQEGPLVRNFASLGTGFYPPGFGDCTIAHPLITTTVGRFAVEADVLVFDPYKITGQPANAKCTVWSGFQNLPADFKDMNQIARNGTDWRNFVAGGTKPGAQSTMAFSDAPYTCLALEKLGPPWHGGYIWVLHATLCENAGATVPIGQSDIDAVVGALQIHVYDPNGNLNTPPQ
jgi:hypothetical protein